MSKKSNIVTASAAAGGMLAGGGLACAVGSSIPVLTTVGGWIGIGVTAATPVGWVIGGAVMGGAVCALGATVCHKIGEAEKGVQQRRAKKKRHRDEELF